MKPFILKRSSYIVGAYITRSFCLCSMIVSLGIFWRWEKMEHKAEKQHIQQKHVQVSYTLILGVIVLDVISLLVLIFSNWSVAFLVKDYNAKERNFSNRQFDFIDKVLEFKSRWLSPYLEAPRASQFLFQRWSNSICRFSLLNYYLHQRAPNINGLLDSLGLRLLLDGLTYVDTYSFNKNLRRLILEELRKKSEKVDDPVKAKDICSARGECVLQSYGLKEVFELSLWVVDMEYDESLLLWHIVTELCYNADRTYHEDRNSSKALSDYMVYLLVIKPMMISNVAGISDLRLRDTEAEALRFIRGALPTDEPDLGQLCRKMMSVLISDVRPRTVKGSRSKSVLFEACRLANRLLKLPEEVRWKVMSRVWVEMLCYAACHCRPANHVKQVSKGGELITVVWLLMTHLGLGEQFHLEDGPTRTKLIVDD